MFLGHFALGFAGKRIAPRASLGLLFLSVQLADVLWPVFLLMDLEHVRIDPGNTPVTPLDFYDYPLTHSLAADLGWAALFTGIYWWFMRDRRSASILGAGVLTHWLLDALSHRPDMPVLPHGPYVGMGLWYSKTATICVELAMFVVGLAIYLRSTRAVDRTGKWATHSLVAFLLIAYFANMFGSPPPSINALAIVANVGSVTTLAWSVWADRHRRES